MGINGFWDVIGSGTVISLAEYTAKHYECHNRPLRIAIDEAGWRFNNVTDAQVAHFRVHQPAANTIEKNILYHLLKLLKLNIQPLFVFDGPQRPNKNGRRGGNRVDYDRIKLLKQTLDHLCVPHHHAKGEAEAECAFLQQHGIVDAVWTDDSDAFMFGATKLIKHYKVGGKKQPGMIQVYEASEVLGRLDLDRDSVVLFALLAGGDYDNKGLQGCGPKIATKLSTKSRGLAHAICRSSVYMPTWRYQLQDAVAMYCKAVEVTSDFPDTKALRNYLHPKVSSVEELHRLRSHRRWWQREMNVPNLRIFLHKMFNFLTRDYMKHIAPIFMIRALVNAITPIQRAENDCYAIRIKPRRASKKNADQSDQSNVEVKITFNAIPAVGFDFFTEPINDFGQRLEDWPDMKGDGTGVTWAPSERLDCEVLECFLRQGLSERAFEIAFNASKGKPSKGNPLMVNPSKVTPLKMKRPATAEMAADAQTSTKKRRKVNKQNLSAQSLKTPSALTCGSGEASLSPISTLNQLQSASGFRIPHAHEKRVRELQPPLLSSVVDLSSDDEDSRDEGDGDVVCRQKSNDAQQTPATRDTDMPTLAAFETAFGPGFVCDRDLLRKLRREHSATIQEFDTPVVPLAGAAPWKGPCQASTMEVIDLT